MLFSPRRPSQHDADLLLGRMVTTRGSADIPDRFLRAVRYALACLSHRGSPTGLRCGGEARESDARIARRTEPREANLREAGREQCDFSRLQRLSGFSPTTGGGATTRAQGAGLGGAMFQQAAPTSQLHEENGAVDKG